MADPLRQALRRTALRCLAQREHSRAELQGRLLRSATRSARARPGRETQTSSGAAAALEPAPDSALVLATLRTTVDALLDQLQSQGLLCDQRFIESRVHARRAQWGSRRIAHELGQHGLSLDPELSQSLQGSEFSRALALWQRRFGVRAEQPKEQLRQMRFLAARGFSGAVVRQVVQSRHDLDENDD